jgi:hypothetical protein
MSTPKERLWENRANLNQSWSRLQQSDWRTNLFGVGALGSFIFRRFPILPLTVASIGFTGAAAYKLGQRPQLVRDVEEKGENTLADYREVMSDDPVSHLNDPQMLDTTRELASQFPMSRVQMWKDSDLERGYWGSKPVPDEVKEALKTMDQTEKRTTNFKFFDTADITGLLAQGRGFFNRAKQTSKDYGFDVDEAWENIKKGPKS